MKPRPGPRWGPGRLTVSRSGLVGVRSNASFHSVDPTEKSSELRIGELEALDAMPQLIDRQKPEGQQALDELPVLLAERDQLAGRQVAGVEAQAGLPAGVGVADRYETVAPPVRQARRLESDRINVEPVRPPPRAVRAAPRPTTLR